jgi:hypothetical protein
MRGEPVRVRAKLTEDGRGAAHSLPMGDTADEVAGVTDPAAALGRLVAVPLGALARWRRGRPMHPDGVVLPGVLSRHGAARPWGVPWLDQAGRDDVVVRFSRGLGLPRRLPDLLGLAVRIPAGEGGPVDLLFTSSGTGALGRRIGVPRLRSAVVRGSIMGYRSDAGTLRLAAFPLGDDGRAWGLAAARGSGAWRRFARLDVLAAALADDPDLWFDAVRRPPPGLVPDGPMARFRTPAYAAARRGRDAARRGGDAARTEPAA